MSMNTKTAFFPNKLSRLVRIATFGDSTASLSTTDTDLSAKILPLIINQVVGSFSLSQFCHFVANGGISGETTTQMLARPASVYSSSRKDVGDVIRTNPDVVIFHGASANDFHNMTLASTTADVDAVFANHIALVSAFTDYGVLVVDSGLLGYDGFSGESVELVSHKRTLGVYFNQKLASHFATEKNGIFVSPQGVVSDSLQFYADCTVDGIHLTNIGAYKIGKKESAAIATRFSFCASGLPLIDFRNLWANPVSGIPSGYSKIQSNSAITTESCSAKELVFSFTTSSETNLTGIQVASAFVTALSGAAINDFYDLLYRVTVQDMSGSPVNFIPYVYCYVTNSDNTQSEEQRVTYEGTYGTKVVGELKTCLRLRTTYGAIGNQSTFKIGAINLPVGTYRMRIKPPSLTKEV